MGNVLGTNSDRKLGFGTTAGNPVSYWAPDIISATDYYPFGWALPGRSSSSKLYRYGYNGMDKDDEVEGDGNSYNTLYRFYDARLGRWISVDPKVKESPDESTYSAMENNPISETDPFGDCPWCVAFLKGAVQEYATQVIINLAQGKDLSDALTDVGGVEILKSGTIDAVTLGVGSLVGKAKAVTKVVGAVDKVNDVEKAAVKTNKVVTTTQKATKAEKNLVKAE